ncbi:amino acid adenylation domain-containing protein [Ideonella sp. DXS22W]|uniref:Amino acid adenylation domain-containing protein n=1 Tax=Pseudaquabacterium inlustre TaxID=2984192 RepID=A0ABU9CH15_9BURK
MSLDGVEDLYELTPLQQGMLFNGLLAPESQAYTIVVDVGVAGPLDTATVQTAWQEVLARHAALRTSFLWERMERPVQVVHRAVDAGVTWHDLAGLPPEAQAARQREIAAAEKASGFDLRRAPLIRLAVLALGGARWRCVWTFHHIVLEGWSAALVMADFWTACEALAAGRPVALPPGPAYADYLRWLRRQDRDAAQAHWREALAGLAVPTRLPYDRATTGGPQPVQQVAQTRLCLSSQAHAALAAFARAQRVTLNTVLHGAFALLLSRSAGEDDVLFGTVASGRPADLDGAHGIVGLFVATLPARVRCAPDEPLLPWLRRLQLALAAMREHGHVSLVDLQAWSDVPAGQPLFEAVLAFENWLDTPPPAGGLLQVADRQVHETSDQPLTLFATFEPTLTLTLMYDVARFDAAPMARMLGQLRTLLEGFVGASEATLLAQLPWLTADERAALLHAGQATATAYPRDASIATLFRAQARQRPDAVALQHLDRCMTYAELDASSDRMAAALQAAGVGHETPVALLSERCFELVVAILGILKAGGAYVPLDPGSPPARLAAMLADARPVLVLAQRALAGRLPAGGAPLRWLDDAAAWADASLPGPCPAQGGSLAYVMYTSGSTGVPKGVCIEQRSVLRLVCGTQFARFGPDETWLMFAPVSFDASTLEIWGALLHGARLVVAPPGPQSLAELGGLIRDGGIRALWLTAALFNQMVAEQRDCLAGVRQLLAGGEALSVPHVQRMLAVMAPDARVINGYGPTENTTFTCTHALAPGSALGDSVPIGRPIANTRVLVADARRQPVPVGVWGELLIGGDGLARGYLNQPALSAQAFVDDPDVPGARLYRSGDRVRWTDAGVIEFGGRIDRQIKLLGHRIEPGEIEAALQRHAQVGDAVVGVVGESEARRLVAWVAGRDGQRPDAAALREHLRALLPAPMLPQHLVVLAALPLTPNGKVDRAALPLPEAAPREAGATPRNAREQRLAACWAEALGRDVVGLDDNFFDLGGNSLLVMKVHGRLQADEPALKVVDLFRHPTVRALAAHLAALAPAACAPVPLPQNPSASAALNAPVNAPVPAPAPTAAPDPLAERARKRREAMRRPARS